MARHDESELTLLNDRNIHALNEAIKREQIRIDILVERMETANRSIAMLRAEFEDLRTSLINMISARL